jgi:hypothetical protein
MEIVTLNALGLLKARMSMIMHSLKDLTLGLIKKMDLSMKVKIKQK